MPSISSPAAATRLFIWKCCVRGARYLLAPESSNSWFAAYPDFQERLESRYRELTHAQNRRSLVIGLRAVEPTRAAVLAFERLVERFRCVYMHDPSVLDWNSGQRFSALYPSLPVFAPPPSKGPLPYVDRSVDVVAVASVDPEILADAMRVAETAVVNFRRGERGSRRRTFTGSASRRREDCRPFQSSFLSSTSGSRRPRAYHHCGKRSHPISAARSSWLMTPGRTKLASSCNTSRPMTSGFALAQCNQSWLP